MAKEMFEEIKRVTEKGVMMSKFKITIEKEGKKETLELDERLHH
jgi:hypothetical protein